MPSGLLVAASLLMMANTQGYPLLLLASFALAVGTGVAGPAPAAYAADIAPPGMNAAAMSSFRMLAETGYVLGPIVLGLIADVFSANAALAWTSAFLVAVGVLFGLFAPEKRRRPSTPVV